jgi:arginyl-tRNA synthetase
MLVEYSSPNTNKPLHLGHVRNNLLGYSVAQILKANGHEVFTSNLVNDRGIHICKSMLAWLKFGNGETPQSSGMKGDHLVGKYYVIFDQKYKEQQKELMAQGLSEAEAGKTAPVMMEAQELLRKWEAGDEETVSTWRTMNGWVYEGFDISYKMLGISFDKFYYESNTYLLGKEIVDEGLQKGVFFKKDDGSVWIDLTAEGLNQKLVLRGDGTSVYITQDLGTADLKFSDFHFDQSVYVVGNEQDYHFKVLKSILEKLGRPYAKGIYHLSYGMVELPEGKMKSREGTVVDADDLMNGMIEQAEETTKALGKTEGLDPQELETLYNLIGLGALKYFILKVDPKKKMLFNPAESIDFQGNTGPFIQYTHARIKSVLRNAAAAGLKTASDLSGVKLSKVEKDMIVQMYRYPVVIKDAGQNMSPGVICNYVFDLARLYNHFYHEHSVLKEPDAQQQALRLQLCTLAATIIRSSFSLLGISVPERM